MRVILTMTMIITELCYTERYYMNVILALNMIKRELF